MILGKVLLALKTLPSFISKAKTIRKRLRTHPNHRAIHSAYHIVEDGALRQKWPPRFKHDYENNNKYDTSYWFYFRFRTGKFYLSFHVAMACRIYANHGAVQCDQ